MLKCQTTGYCDRAFLPLSINVDVVALLMYIILRKLSDLSRHPLESCEQRSAHGIQFMNREYRNYRDNCLELGGMKYHQLETNEYRDYHPFRLSRVAHNQSQSGQASDIADTQSEQWEDKSNSQDDGDQQKNGIQSADKEKSRQSR